MANDKKAADQGSTPTVTMEDVIAAHSKLKDAQAAVAQTEKEVKGYTAKLEKRKTTLAGVQAEYNAAVAAFEASKK